MKKIILVISAIIGSFFAFAQDSVSHPLKSKDRLLPRFCIDASYMYGALSQNLKTIDLKNAYTNNVNTLIAAPSFSNGKSMGFNLQAGYFFGRERHFGIGAGIIYFSQTGDLGLDTIHAEYMATDLKDASSKFRQIITSNHKIKEELTISSINIPLVLKYKYQFGKNINGMEGRNRFGITADLGALINISSQSSYSTNASFDYEAIYRLVAQGNKVVSVYDDATVPDANDWVITKAYHNAVNPGGNVQHYFDSLYNNGYNVKLGAKPNSNTGSSNTTDINLGMIAQASLTYQLNYRFSLMLGAHYAMQLFNTPTSDNYRITDRVGTYSPINKGITSTVSSVYGANAGIRYYLGGGARDIDDDGFPDKQDDCPLFYGKSTHGCPDRDGDGVPDKDDQCPDVPGTVNNHGCPETSVNAANIDPNNPNNLPQMEISRSNINFGFGKSDLVKSFYPTLDEVVTILRNNSKLMLVINGYTDNIGGYASNLSLSLSRSESVSKYLISKGIDKKRLIINGYGKSNFLYDNNTEENRAKNRRVEMKLVFMY